MRIFAISAGALLISTPLYAVDVTSGANYQIKLSEVGSYESNPLKLPTSATSLWGSTTTPELIINDNNGTSKFNLDMSAVENLYDHSAFDSTDFHGKAGLDEQNERWDVGLNGKVDYDTTRTSELTTFGLDLPDVRHFGMAASPDISYHTSPLDTFSIDSTAAHSTYNNSAFIDYNFYSINPSFAHKFSPNDSMILTLETQRYQTQEGPNNTVDSYGPTLGWQSTPTPRLSTIITAGFEKSSQDSAVTTSKSTTMDYIFKGELDYKDERDTANLIASRSHQPFGNGTETLLNAFTANGSHAINPLISVNAAATYEYAEYGSIVGVNLNHQASGTAGLSYHMLDDVDATANYQYTTETLTNVSNTITDNAILFGLVWHPRAGAF